MTSEAVLIARAAGTFAYRRPSYGRGLFNRLQAILGNLPAESVLLLPGRTDTRWFRLLRDHPRCFIRGRVRLNGHAGGAPFPSALFYLGTRPELFAAIFTEFGDIWCRFKGVA